MSIFENLSDLWNSNPTESGFNFGPSLPNLVYNFDGKELGQLFARRYELTKHFTNIDKINKLLWLGFGIDDKEFEYLCAYFIEREFWYTTDIQWGFQDGWIDIRGCRGTKSNSEFIAIQCKQWNTWHINERWITEIYKKMSRAKDEYNARLLLATIHYISNPARELVEGVMDIWDYNDILECYDKYFSDPDAGWEEFENFIKQKKNAAIITKQHKEKEIIETTKTKESIIIQRKSVGQRFDILRDIRKKEAERWKIYPNYVFSDDVLYEMVKRHPQTKLEFLKISGIWEKKYKKHCALFAEAIRGFRE